MFGGPRPPLTAFCFFRNKNSFHVKETVTYDSGRTRLMLVCNWGTTPISHWLDAKGTALAQGKSTMVAERSVLCVKHWGDRHWAAELRTLSVDPKFV